MYLAMAFSSFAYLYGVVRPVYLSLFCVFVTCLRCFCVVFCVTSFGGLCIEGLLYRHGGLLLSTVCRSSLESVVFAFLSPSF